MLVSEVKENMLKPVKYRDIEWILTEYIYWVDEQERKAMHSVTLRDNKTGRCYDRALIDEVEVIK